MGSIGLNTSRAPPPSDASGLLAVVKAIQDNPPKDPATRRAVSDALRKASVALEEPADTVNRISHCLLEPVTTKVATDTQVLQTLAKSNYPKSIMELADTHNIEAELLRRILRFLASINVVDEYGPDLFVANNATRAMASPHGTSALAHLVENMNPVFLDMPAGLAALKYRDPIKPTETVFNHVYGTDQPAMLWFLQYPQRVATTSAFMTHQRDGLAGWLDTFPFEAEFCAATDADTVLMVDIGGGNGHQSAALRQCLPPSVQGRIVLEDVPPVLAQAPDAAGFEKLPHNFWTPQPIKGARAYYLRNILHDWTDEDATRLLQLTRDAMGPGSAILIDEMVFPQVGTDWRATYMDLAMMAVVAGRERTVAQWEKLARDAGLKIDRVVTYLPQRHESILVLTAA